MLDFYCPELTLCIEVDGSGHEFRQPLDQARDAWLAEQGARTICLGAQANLDDMDLVLERLTAELPPPALRATSPVNGGGD
jgi:very-short-patch-repair endonuclease